MATVRIPASRERWAEANAPALTRSASALKSRAGSRLAPRIGAPKRAHRSDSWISEPTPPRFAFGTRGVASPRESLTKRISANATCDCHDDQRNDRPLQQGRNSNSADRRHRRRVAPARSRRGPTLNRHRRGNAEEEEKNDKPRRNGRPDHCACCAGGRHAPLRPPSSLSADRGRNYGQRRRDLAGEGGWSSWRSSLLFWCGAHLHARCCLPIGSHLHHDSHADGQLSLSG
jgi:hypothetical protein